MEPKLGEIKTFSEAKCHCCHTPAEIATNGKLQSFLINRIWNGLEWIPLESYNLGQALR